MKSLQVEEGRQAAITTDNIKVLPDFGQMGVPESGVLFHVIELPQHGELTLGKAGKRRRLFTLDHLRANKLKYLHNGNEDIVDRFVFEMEIQVSNFVFFYLILTKMPFQGVEGLALPPALTVRQRFLFEIRILPVNDPPRLTGGPAWPRPPKCVRETFK